MRWSLLIVLMAVLSGPMYPTAGTAAEVTFWTSETPPERVAVITYLANVFMALHPDINVRVVSIDENDLLQQAIARQGTPQAPTLVNTGGELIAALGEKHLLDTRAATTFVESIGKKRFFKGALEFLAMPKAGYYGVPHHGWVQCIWYRADWFEKAGLAPPTTWKNILKAATHFNNPEKGIYGILVGTKADMYAEQVFTQIALSNNATMFTPDGRLAFNSPRMVEALDFYLQLAENTPPGPQTWRGRDFYIQGRLAMLFYSTFIMDDLALSSAAADSLGTTNFKNLTGARFDPFLAGNTQMTPTIHRQSTSGYGTINGFALFRIADSKTRKATIEFLSFLYQPGPYTEWLHMAPGGMMPVLRGMAENEPFIRDPQGVFRRYGRPKIRRILSGLDSVRSFGLVKGHRNPLASIIYAERIIPQMIVKAKNREMTPEQAVAWAEQEMRRVAAEYAGGAPSPMDCALPTRRTRAEKK